MSVFKTTIVQWWLDGRKVRSGTPGAKKVKKKSGKWHGRVPGNRRPIPLSKNKVAAEQRLAALVRGAEMGQAGMADPFSDHRKRPLEDHLADWAAVLEARGCTAKHVGMKRSQVGKLLEACRFALMAHLSASKVEQALAEMRARQPRFGIQTSNHHLASIKQFARWLVRDGRAAENPLAHLTGGNVALDRRHVRRELTDGEMQRLLDHAFASSRRLRLPGPDREMLYLVSANTGLRASECASLTPESFSLDAEPATVTVEAGYSKHRREDVIPLHPGLVARILPWIAGRAAGRRLWPGSWAKGSEGGVILKADMADARAAWVAEAAVGAEGHALRHLPDTSRGTPGIQPGNDEVSEVSKRHLGMGARERSSFLLCRNEDDLVVDFHSLRHTFITNVVKSGASPKEAQTLARHSTITLTMDRYAHVGIADSARVVQSLPPVPSLSRCVPRCVPTSDPDRGGVRLIETTGTEEGGPGVLPVDRRNPLILRLHESDRDGVIRHETSGEAGIAA